MEEVRSIRRRALRAAKVTTMGLVTAAPGCYMSRELPPDLRDEVARPADAGPADGGVCEITDDWEQYSACCDAVMWDWDRGCSAWGPFVPPSDDELG